MSCVQEALADDRMESEDLNLTGLVSGKSTVNACRELNLHPVDKHTVNLSLDNDMNPENFEENGCVQGDLEIKQVKPQGHLPPIAVDMECVAADNCLSTSLTSSGPAEQIKPSHLVSECSEGTNGLLEGPDRAEDIHNGVVIDNEPSTPFVHQTPVESVGARLGETVASPSGSHVTSDFEDPGRKTFSSGTDALESKGYLEDDQASPRPEILNEVEIDNDAERSCSPSRASTSNAVCPLESPQRPEVVNAEAHVCKELKENKTLNSVGHEALPLNEPHVLRACSSHLSQPDMPSGRGINLVAVPNYHQRWLIFFFGGFLLIICHLK